MPNRPIGALFVGKYDPIFRQPRQQPTGPLPMRLLKAAFLAPAALVAFLFVGLHTGGPRPAVAQDTHRAAAVVNDQVISAFDLVMRTRLTVLAAGLRNAPEDTGRLQAQVLRALVDERLQVQEAERLEIAVEEDQVRAAVAQVAQQNNMEPEQFQRYLLSNNVAPQALVDQLRNSLTWQRVIQRRLRPTIEITEEEIDEVVARLESSHGRLQLRVSEILLTLDSAGQEEDTRRAAERLVQQLRQGADFAVLAQQFSRAATAAVGGELGWIDEGQLPDELRRALSGAQPNSLIGPVQTFGGYYIFLLHELRRLSVGDPRVRLKQLLFALPPSAGAEEIQAARLRAEAAREQIDGCEGFDELADELGSPGSGDLGEMKLGNLNASLRQVVATLPVGQPSQPVELPSGLSLLLVCSRQNDAIDREQIRESLTAQRLDLLVRRYLRDLRRAANVDIRL